MRFAQTIAWVTMVCCSMARIALSMPPSPEESVSSGAQEPALPTEAEQDGDAVRAIIVRLSPKLPQPSNDAQTLADVAKELKLIQLAEVLSEFKLVESRSVVRGITREQALAPQQPPRRSELIRRLRSYWRINVQHVSGQVEQILDRLNRLKEVDLAYKEFTFTEPAVHPHDDPHSAGQGYLDPAPLGIDARFAWTQCHGTGAGIGLVDIERGWHESHEDYVSKSPQLVHGDERPASERHGTAVLGEIIADDNTLGVIGIAPGTDYAYLSSYYDATMKSSDDVAAAIYHALPHVSPGHVLLLEVQDRRRGFPAEVDDAIFDATQLAVISGIIVVSAAGNGGWNLDSYVDASGKKRFDRSSPDFCDSGAIMVGAADSGIPHVRAIWSNFGSRIDCYAWGRNVTTTGHNGDLDDGGGNVNAAYTKSFNGTSSAAPIIAGAAILVQGMSQANAGKLIPPDQMRALLADPSTGTPQGPGVAGHIGVMPDLRALISAYGELTPAPSAQPAMLQRTASTTPRMRALRRGSRTIARRLFGPVRRRP